MKNVIFLVIGIALIGYGGYSQFGQSRVSDADRTRCESQVRAENEGYNEALAALLPKCTDPGMVAMMDAQASGASAQATAQNIAAANQSDTDKAMIDYAMIGMGIVLLLGGAALGRRRAA